MPNKNTVDVDLYCTHGELADELGGARALAKIVPPDADTADPTRLVRAQALRDVLKGLARRTPPITEATITDKSDLKDSVAFGALMRLYRAGITTTDDKNDRLYKIYKKKFEGEVGSLQISTAGAARVYNAVTVFRR